MVNIDYYLNYHENDWSWEEVNILPKNDTKEHTEGATCECKPVVEVHGFSLLIIHNAFDNREILEEIEEMRKA